MHNQISFKELQKKIESSPLLQAIMKDRLKWAKYTMQMWNVPGYSKGFEIKLKEVKK